jgi:hypothetical protein
MARLFGDRFCDGRRGRGMSKCTNTGTEGTDDRVSALASKPNSSEWAGRNFLACREIALATKPRTHFRSMGATNLTKGSSPTVDHRGGPTRASPVLTHFLSWRISAGAGLRRGCRRLHPAMRLSCRIKQVPQFTNSRGGTPANSTTSSFEGWHSLSGGQVVYSAIVRLEKMSWAGGVSSDRLVEVQSALLNHRNPTFIRSSSR